MYYDDMYGPNNQNDDYDDVSVSTTFSAVKNSNRFGNNNAPIMTISHDSKTAENGYYYYKTWHNNRLSKIEMYNSGNSMGYRIRDPVTGARLGARIGSKAELDYFKVRATGFSPENPVTLFYDSPEHYERHHKTTLPEAIKEKWWREHRDIFANRPGVDVADRYIPQDTFKGPDGTSMEVTVVH